MKTFILAIALALAGCGGKAAPVKVENTLDTFEVGKLFDVEGCTVYRFRDAGRYHYFASCPGTTINTHGSNDKTHSRFDDNVETR